MKTSDDSLLVDQIGRLTAVPKILQAVTHITGLRFAAVARVTETSWTACAVHDAIGFGLEPGGELVLETTLCNEIRQHGQALVFGQASTHALFADHPCPKLYGFESYISVPITLGDGRFFGTLCALDPLPAMLDEQSVRTLELFADLIAAQLETERRLEQSDGALHLAEGTARLRDQFIAVLGHDLRSPLQAMAMGTQMLREAPLHARWEQHLDRMQRSCERMGELIRDVLDLARGRLGGGIPVQRQAADQLLPQLRQVIAEVQSGNPRVTIVSRFEMDGPVDCDPNRISQLFSNLLANAVTHGDAGRPIQVEASSDPAGFRLSVTNWGEPIAAQTMERLFEPFWRGGSEQGAPKLALGLGLGLYIAAEIAKAHEGTLQVSSSAQSGTSFVFEIPSASCRSAAPQ